MFRQYGHEPGLMAAKFVSPSRMAGKSGKSDAADAQSICAGEHKKPVAIIECSYHNKAQWPPPQIYLPFSVSVASVRVSIESCSFPKHGCWSFCVR